MTEVESIDRLSELEQKHNRDFEQEFDEPAQACILVSCLFLSSARE